MLNIKNIHKEGLIMANQTQILNVSDEMKFDDNVQTKNVKEQEENMYSSSSDTTEELCSSSTNGTCGDLRVAMSERFVEILDFPYFYEHFLFQKNSQNGLEKQLENEIRVRVEIPLISKVRHKGLNVIIKPPLIKS